MKDGIIKADGTSRLARSVADFKSQYPTYDAFASAMAAGTLPLDILFNESGWSQLPDFLNQANLLKAATAALYGKDPTAVPDDIFALIPPALAQKVSMELRWENASPTSSFAAQAVSVDMSDGDMIAVEFYNPEQGDLTLREDGSYAGNYVRYWGGKNVQLFNVEISGKGNLFCWGVSHRYGNFNYGYSSVAYASRRFTFTDKRTLTFETAYGNRSNGSVETGNGNADLMLRVYQRDDFMVPVRIWVIKGVQA